MRVTTVVLVLHAAPTPGVHHLLSGKDSLPPCAIFRHTPSGPGSSALATYLHHSSLSNTLMPSPATQHPVPGPYRWGPASGRGGVSSQVTFH